MKMSPASSTSAQAKAYERKMVLRRHVGDRDALAHFFQRPAFRDGAVAGQGGAGENAQVYRHDDMLPDTKTSRDPAGRFYLYFVPLSVTEGQGVNGEAPALGDGERRGGVESTAEQDHGLGRVHRPLPFYLRWTARLLGARAGRPRSQINPR